MARAKRNATADQSMIVWVLIVTIVVFAAMAVLFVVQRSSSGVVDNFQTCKDAGGRIAESYPEQCFIKGKSFSNSAAVDTADEYVGLSEQEALDKARLENKTARVVERDGEGLPSTMDLADGRLNFYVRDGVVYRVYVERLQQ